MRQTGSERAPAKVNATTGRRSLSQNMMIAPFFTPDVQQETAGNPQETAFAPNFFRGNEQKTLQCMGVEVLHVNIIFCECGYAWSSDFFEFLNVSYTFSQSSAPFFAKLRPSR